MEGSFSDNQVHEWLQTIADGSWISLHYASPLLDDTTYAELSGGGYQRFKMDWSQPSNRSIWSLAAARFVGLPECVLTHYGSWDDPLSGRLQFCGRLPEKKIITAGAGYLIPAGDLACGIG